MGQHVAVFALLNPGHVYPTLGLCCELVRRGYRITYPTTERFSDQVRQTGAEPIPIKVPKLTNMDAIAHYPAADDPKFWNVLTSIFWPNYLTTAASTVANVERFYRENVPDVILYDWPSFAGRILAHRLCRPAIQHFAHFATRGSMIREGGIYLNPEPTVAFGQLVDSFLSAYGIEGKDNLWHTERLNIYFHPREFQPDGELFDDRFCFVGPCLRRPPGTPWKRPPGDKPVVLISESQVTKESNFLDICVEAFAGSQYHVVFSVGENSAVAPARRLPPNFEFNTRSYNTEILKHAALIVCQGSTGTTMEALYYGVPVLAVAPRTPYHSEVAYRLTELNLGMHLPQRGITANAIRQAVEQMLRDTVLLQSVKRMQECMNMSGGETAAADRIENFLSEYPSPSELAGSGRLLS